MKTATRLLALSVLASGAFFTTSAFACSTDAWTTASSGATPGDPTTSIARVAGKCGLRATGTGIVTDNTPAAEATFIARFYFFGKNLAAGTHTIFRATSANDGTGTEQFRITYDGGTSIAVNASGGGGTSVSAAVLKSKWNLIEVSWTSGGSGSLWVNADATNESASATFTSGTGSIGSAQLGAVTSVGGSSAFFDDYVSHRTTAIGPALIGDANNDGVINIFDVSAVMKEADPFDSQLQTGTPDCNLDGTVNIFDVSGVMKASDPFDAVPCSNGAL